MSRHILKATKEWPKGLEGMTEESLEFFSDSKHAVCDKERTMSKLRRLFMATAGSKQVLNGFCFLVREKVQGRQIPISGKAVFIVVFT